MQWEYHILQINPDADADALLEDLDGFGADGWELVMVVPTDEWHRWVFKRPLRQE